MTQNLLHAYCTDVTLLLPSERCPSLIVKKNWNKTNANNEDNENTKTMTATSKRGAKANSSHSAVRSKPLIRIHKPHYLIPAIIDLETGTTLHM